MISDFFFRGGPFKIIFPFPLFSVFSMVSSSEVRIVCPSISFLFARLGASLGVSRNFVPLVGGFVFEGSSLSVALADFLPLLRQSLDWFKGLMSGQ